MDREICGCWGGGDGEGLPRGQGHFGRDGNMHYPDCGNSLTGVNIRKTLAN